VTNKATQTHYDNSEVRYVGFWVRFLAFVVDSVAAMLVFSPLVIWMLGGVDLQQINTDDTAQLINVLYDYSVNSTVETLLMGVAVVVFWIYKSATPGKMIFKAIIVNASDGGRPSNVRLVIRYLGYFVNMFALGFGFLWIGWDARKQGWHDKMAGTIVVRKPD
jgi:uncharacterized RDD family membrane protein YckC